MTTIKQYLTAHRDGLVDELREWVRIPSVAGSPEHAVSVSRSAHWLAGTLRELGFPEVTIRPDGDTVYAEWCAAPGAPTVLIYSHHDVRAVKDDQWAETPPFAPVQREGYVYGRGASDAKGQVLAHLWGIRAHLAATGRTAPAVNLKVLVEGEEEAGSPHLSDVLDAHPITADLIVFSDTLMWHRSHPAMCVSMRGGINAQIEVYGPLRDVHSGAASGPAPNPVVELSRLLAGLHDDKGRITLPGFYDDVVAPSERFRAEIAALPYTDEDWLARSETRTIGGEHGYSVLERLWIRPAAEVLTVSAGDISGPARGAIPAVATASLMFRTVPGQRAEVVAGQLRRWVAEQLGDRVEYELTISEEQGQEPYRTPEDHPAVATLAEAMAEGFGGPVGRMGNAGGGPAELLSRKTGAPVLFFGTGLPEDRWHDGDERVSVDMLVSGAVTLGEFWTRIAPV